MYNEIDLIKILKKECIEKSGVPFRATLKINGRLKRSLGLTRYKVWTDALGVKHSKNFSIEISKSFLEVATYNDLVLVLRHEYAHYITASLIGKHSHSEPTFINWCKRLDTTANATARLESFKNEKKTLKYTIRCSDCFKKLSGCSSASNEKIKNSDNYLSGCCEKPLTIIKNY